MYSHTEGFGALKCMLLLVLSPSYHTHTHYVTEDTCTLCVVLAAFLCVISLNRGPARKNVEVSASHYCGVHVLPRNCCCCNEKSSRRLRNDERFGRTVQGGGGGGGVGGGVGMWEEAYVIGNRRHSR